MLLTILRKAKREKERKFGWDTSCIPVVIGISGPYNVDDLKESLNSRGLSHKLLYSIMEGEDNLKRSSADYIVTTEPEYCDPDVIRKIPPILLLHGTADQCVPFLASRRTAEALASVGIKTFLRFYAEKSHTDVVIEDLVYADDPCKEDAMSDIVGIVLAKTQARAILPRVSYEIKDPRDQSNESEPKRGSQSPHSFCGTPPIIDDIGPLSSSSMEFGVHVHVDSKDERFRLSFLAPQNPNPKDGSAKKIKRSILPWILWKLARLTNPF